MSINIFNLEKVIAQKIATATSAEDIVYLTSALKQLKNGSLTVVTNFSELPLATTVPIGTLYFVKNDKLVYQNLANNWVTITTNNYGSIWSFGQNCCAILGDETTVNKCSPVSLVGGFTDWSQVSVGDRNVIALRANGTLWSWGRNNYGRLGDGTTTDKLSPVSVIGGFTDWCQVSTLGRISSAIRTNGTLWTWGYNSSIGTLGDGTTTNKCSPVSVINGFTDWCQVSVGTSTIAAVRQNGTLWTWGCNNYGHLGDGTTTNKSSPISVVGGFTDWCQVSNGGSAAMAAVRQNGTLWTWGRAYGGVLGDGTTVSKSSPVSVLGGFTDWCQVAVSSGTMAAVRTNGTLWAWGSNLNGELGDGSSGISASKLSPVSVIGGFTDWCQVSISGSSSSAVRTNGTLWTWGSGFVGRLGDGTTVAKSSPVSVIAFQGNWSSVSNGPISTAAINKGTI